MDQIRSASRGLKLLLKITVFEEPPDLYSQGNLYIVTPSFYLREISEVERSLRGAGEHEDGDEYHGVYRGPVCGRLVISRSNMIDTLQYNIVIA